MNISLEENFQTVDLDDEEKNEKIIGAIVLNHEYEECYQNIYWQIYAEDEEVTIIHRFCIHPDYRGCGKYLLKQIIKIAKKWVIRMMI